MVTVSLPERLGRRMSLGPFEDPRDLLRFLLIVGAGGLVALLTLPWIWVPIAAMGGVLTLVRHNEETLLELLGRRLRFALRRVRPPRWMGRWGEGHPPPRGPAGRSAEEGRPWEIWRTAPAPVCGRDPSELHRQALALLRRLAPGGREVLLVRRTRPWDVRPFLPPGPVLRAQDRMLREGYVRLLNACAQGKRRAELYLLLPSGGPARWEDGPHGPGDAWGLTEAGWYRLEGPALREAARRVLPLSTQVRERR